MENLDLMVLRALRDWRKAGRHAALVTVVGTWGSSPRPVGSVMAMAEQGGIIGSVSGGCIEDDLIYRYADPSAWQGASRVPKLVTYGVSADEAHRFGLPCGGTLELLLEHDPDAEALDSLVRALEAGRLVRRSIRLKDGCVHQADADSPSELTIDAEMMSNTFGPEYRMLLIGAGQLTEYLSTMALFSGFAVTVCDPRPEYRGAWSVPGITMATGMPDDVVREFKPDRRTCIVALTHDPKLDDLALLEALATEAFYIGAIGSRRNSAARRERMIEHFEISHADLAKLRGPVGIYVGSKTPAEIAVSIMAEILAVKNGVLLPPSIGVGRAKNVHSGASERGVACGV